MCLHQSSGTTIGLIPYADLLNHQSYVDSEYGDSYSGHDGVSCVLSFMWVNDRCSIRNWTVRIL